MASRSEIMIVGLGRFGSAAATSLMDLGQDVVGVDSDEKLVQRHAPLLTEAVQVDATDIDAMRLIGAEEVQTAVVAIGNDIEASILAASVLLELEVPRVWAKAVSDRHGQILGRLGVHRGGFRIGPPPAGNIQRNPAHFGFRVKIAGPVPGRHGNMGGGLLG